MLKRGIQGLSDSPRHINFTDVLCNLWLWRTRIIINNNSIKRRTRVDHESTNVELITKASRPSGYYTSPMSFPQFNRLPKELQHKIWTFMFPAPRIVDIFAVPVQDRLEEKLIPNSCGTDPKSASWVQTRIERVFTENSRLPTIFQVCRDSRSVVLLHYRSLYCEPIVQDAGERELESLPPETQEDKVEVVFCRTMVKGQKPFSLLGLNRDLLFLENPISGSYSLLDGPGGPSLGTLMRWLSSDIKKGLRAFAMSGFSWCMAAQASGLEVLTEFEKLEELYVTALDTNISTQLGRPWMDIGLNAGNSVDEIEKDVRRGVEELSKEHPQWKIPLVKVLYDKSAVMMDFDSNG